MSHDRELEIRRQFLDEAQEYLDTLDAAILGIADQSVDIQRINGALRAAHSIKGGAGMMGFQVLSELAHRLEDSFKVLKIDKTIAVHSQIENLLLSAVTSLRQIIDLDRAALQNQERSTLDPHWLTTEVEPIFEQLHAELGDPQEENAASVLSAEEGQEELISLLFETEVEGCLQRLEGVIATPGQPCLREEVAILAQELGGLGEMLQLPSFVQLCEAVAHQATHTTEIPGLAEATLRSWRQAQAATIAGQYDQIPSQIEGWTMEVVPTHPAIVTEFSDANAEATVWNDNADWYDDALAADELAINDRGYTEFQPLAVPARSIPAAAKVTDFNVLEAKSDAIALEADPDVTVRVPMRQLNQLNDLFGELTLDRNGLELHLKRLRELTKTLHDRVQTLDFVNVKLRDAYDRVTVAEQGIRSRLTGRSEEGSESSAFTLGANPSLNPLSPLGFNPESSFGSRKSSFDILELDRYNDLHLLSQQVMETIVQLQEVTEDVELGLEDADQSARNLTKTAKQFQLGLTQLRMRPLSDVVDRFPRAVREWSLQYGKRVRLNIVGGKTLIDRNIIEALNDPLMHLLRNAFDHGIELPEVRESQGKPAEGLIEIRAVHQGNRTVITIRDDGAGIPLDQIRARAHQMGLDPMLLSTARDEDILSLIFEPGFSTREQVTTLSGRGVGMDVVRSNIRQIRGEISVNTQVGVGTTFTLSVPFALSTVRVLLVECNNMLLAFPTDVVEELFLLKPNQITQIEDTEILSWQGHVVQFVRLQRLLQFNCPQSPHGFETPPTIAATSALVVNQNSQLLAIQIDRCWGEQEATIRRVEGNLPVPVGFSGCTILGDGRVVPLINLAEALRSFNASVNALEQREPQRLPSASFFEDTGNRFVQRASLPPSPVPSILVVDDSINVRRFLALTLERAGYRVEQAKDGQDGLELLENGLPIQAVICDIEMPRLDGYGFLAKVKANPTLSQLPVMMLTSRTGEKHRQLAENLGAAAYFSKPYNEQELLRSLEQLVSH
jgi:chemosensory pili system protein ChpA (sensor histidine kinase/response regulator)